MLFAILNTRVKRLVTLLVLSVACSLQGAVQFTFTDHAWLGQQFAHFRTNDTTIIANWTLDELTATTRKDTSHTNDLLDIAGNVTNVTGLIGNAAHFIGSGTPILSSNYASLKFTAQSFTIGTWIKFDHLDADQSIIAKWTFDYLVLYSQADNRLEFYRTTEDGTVSTILKADSFGAPSTNIWYYVVCGQDFGNNRLFISVNNGTVDTTAFANNGYTSDTPFVIGQLDTVSGSGQVSGSVDQTDVWSGVLGAANITRLYNGGAGRDPITNP